MECKIKYPTMGGRAPFRLQACKPPAGTNKLDGYIMCTKLSGYKITKLNGYKVVTSFIAI